MRSFCHPEIGLLVPEPTVVENTRDTTTDLRTTPLWAYNVRRNDAAARPVGALCGTHCAQFLEHAVRGQAGRAQMRAGKVAATSF